MISVLFGEEIILLQGKANVSVNLHKQALFELHTSEMPQETQGTRGRKNRPLVPLDVMCQQASPFGDKRQFVGIIPSP